SNFLRMIAHPVNLRGRYAALSSRRADNRGSRRRSSWLPVGVSRIQESAWTRTGGIGAAHADLLLIAGRFRLEHSDLADQGLDSRLQASDFLSIFAPIALEAVD